VNVFFGSLADFFLESMVAQACVVRAAKVTFMKNWMESYAAKLTAGVQTIGVGLDPEVLMLPGGSIMALVLWLYEHRPHGKTLADAQHPVADEASPPTDQSLH